MSASKTYILTYGNPLVNGNQSLPVKASNPTDAVIRVLGGCDEVNGTSYRAGKLFGRVDEVSK